MLIAPLSVQCLPSTKTFHCLPYLLTGISWQAEQQEAEHTFLYCSVCFFRLFEKWESVPFSLYHQNTGHTSTIANQIIDFGVFLIGSYRRPSVDLTPFVRKDLDLFSSLRISISRMLLNTKQTMKHLLGFFLGVVVVVVVGFGFWFFTKQEGESSYSFNQKYFRTSKLIFLKKPLISLTVSSFKHSCPSNLTNHLALNL